MENEHEVQKEELSDEDDLSTAPTTMVPEIKIEVRTKKSNNRFELLEHLISFLDGEEELNPVLAGYFSKVFSQLLSTKAKEVFSYVYSHP